MVRSGARHRAHDEAAAPRWLLEPPSRPVDGPARAITSGDVNGPLPGNTPGDPEHDPWEHLFDDDFVAGAPFREPSATERERAAQRSARAAELHRRLSEEAGHQRALAERDRRVARRYARSVRVRRLTGPLVVIALIAGAVWYTTGRDLSGSATAPRPETGGRATDLPPPGVDASDAPIGAPPPAPDSPGPFEFAHTQPDSDRPVAWDPCRAVRYVVNPDGAPEGATALLEAAIARTAAATGLRFTPVGTTDETWSKDRESYQPDRYGERWAPALIAWSTEDEVAALAGYVAGMGGGAPVSDPSGAAAYVTGQMVLDAADLTELLEQPGGDAAVQAVIQHELGHLVGLDHVADPTQLMYTEGDPSAAMDWGSGDLAGLHELGSGECFPDL